MELADLLCAEEAAQTLGIGADRMRVLLRTRRVPARKVGGRWVVLRSDLALVAQRTPGRPRRHQRNPASIRDTLATAAQGDGG